MSSAANVNSNHHPRAGQGDDGFERRLAPVEPTIQDEHEPLEVLIESVGAGPAVVCLHGLLGQNEHWKPVARRLAETGRSCHLVQAPILSLRGRQCTIEGATEVTRLALETALTEPAVFIGNSMGGQVALRIALEHPSMARAIILAGSSGLFERTDGVDELAKTRRVEHRPSRDWIHNKISELFYDESLMSPALVERAHAALSERRAARALVRLSRSTKADYMGPRLHRVGQPVHLIWGRQDIVTPPRVAEEFKALLPGATLHWIESCGHTPMLEKPDDFADAIATFLDRLDAAEAGDAEGRQEVA